jgi:hypothetical protein
MGQFEAFICRQQVEMFGQAYASFALLPETVAQATPDKDVLQISAAVLTIQRT